MDLMIHVGNAVFMEESEIDVSEELPKFWSPRQNVRVYPYVEFPSLERAYVGLALVKESKKGPKEKWIDSVQVDQMTWENSIAPLTEFREALELLGEGTKWAFEEYPYVEVDTEGDYKKALLAIADEAEGPKEWSPRKKDEDSGWEGPGVYDFRERPPTRVYKSVLEYEMSSMESEADGALEYMFQGDKWKEDLRKLMEDNL
jgi:hypothetical protein